MKPDESSQISARGRHRFRFASLFGTLALLDGLDAEDAVVIERSTPVIPNGSSRLPSTRLLDIAAAREAQLDTLADAVAAHLDTDALLRLITEGLPRDLPALRVTR